MDFRKSKNDIVVESIVKEMPAPKKCAGCGSKKDLVRISGVYVCKKCRGEMVGK